MQFNYPIFVSLADRHCIVAGLGSVGMRKLKTLLQHGVGSVLVLDVASRISDRAQTLINAPQVCFARRMFAESDLPCFMVFAATGNPDENSRIVQICRRRNILCNCATEPAQGDFIVPAVASSGTIQAALSTGGDSPCLATQWRAELEAWLNDRQPLATVVRKLRPLVMQLDISQPERAALLKKICQRLSGLDNAAHPRPELVNEIKAEFPPRYAGAIEKIFYGNGHVLS